MESYNKKNKTDFENAWSEALENAEATPDSKVWQNINNELLHADHVRLKGYYKTYKMIAAASVSLLLLAGTAFTYFYIYQPEYKSLQTQTETTEKQPEAIAKNQQNNITEGDKNINKVKKNQEVEESITESLESAQQESSFNQTLSNSDILVQDKADTEKVNNTLVSNSSLPSKAQKLNERAQQSTDDAFHAVSSIDIKKHKLVVFSKNEMALPPKIYQREQKQTPMPNYNQQIVLAEETEEIEIVKRDKSKRFYADVNVLTDYFNPNLELNSPQVNQVVIGQLSSLSEEMNTQLLGQENAPSVSFSYGINMGVKLSGKWIVEGGVSYANYNTQSLSNLAIANVNNGIAMPVTILNRPLIDNETYEATLLDLGNLYTINNSFEFASIPIRAGYIVGLKKINLILKAGVNTGLFLRNEISANDDALEPYVNKPNDSESPFRKVHLNGLVSNEINYALNQNYSFSVAANYRFALNSLTKEGENINSMPDSYGIGMVFRYHFN